MHLVADENRRNEDRAGGETPFVGTGLDDDHAVPPRLLEPVDDGERSDVDRDARPVRSLLDDESVVGWPEHCAEVRLQKVTHVIARDRENLRWFAESVDPIRRAANSNCPLSKRRVARSVVID